MNAFLGTVVAWLSISAIVGGLWGCPQYRVYTQRQEGMAELARAESNRQIAIREAEAKEQSAASYAASDTLRAWGIRRSNEIIAEGLGGPEGYLRFLAIEAMREGAVHGNKTIYIPTEGNIPVTEAGRR